jgi:hypothetical protein
VAKEAPKAAPVDLTPVPVPANLVLLARAPRPGAALDQLAHWVLPGMPSLAPSIADSLARSLTGENLGRMFDLARGIDVAMTTDLDKEPLGQSFGVSVALADEAAAKRAFSTGPYKLVAIGNGAFRIEGLAEARRAEAGEDDGDGDDDNDEPGEKETKGCGLFPAVGDAPLRLVCGEGPELFTTLGPYLTRTLPRTKAPSDGHFELRLAPIHGYVDKNRGQLSTFAAGLMSALGGAGPVQELTSAALVELIDLVSDLDTLTFDAKADDAVAEIRTETGFRSQTALMTRLGLANADKIDVAPPTFLRLPKDAELAAYGRGAPDEELVRPRQLVGRALSRALGSTNLKPADAQAVADAVAAMISLPAWSYAFGHDLAELEAASQKLQASPEGAAHDAAMAKMAGAFLGWHVFSQEDGGASAAHLKNAIAAWNRPGVQKALKSAGGSPPPTAKLVKLPPKLGLPAGTVAAEITIFDEAPAKGGKAAKGKPVALFTLHALAVPEGTGRSWGAFGTNRDALAALLKSALGQSGDDATLAKRAGIEAVRDARASSAGFLSERGVLLLLGAGLAMDEDPRALSRAVAAVKQNPKDADVVAPWTAVAHVGPEKGGSMKGQLRVPRRLVEGVAGFLLHGMH